MMNPSQMPSRRIAFFLILSLVLSVSGCQNTGEENRRTAGQLTDDIAIETSIRSRLIADGSIPSRRIEINVFRGTVTLYGRVPSEATRSKVLATANGVRGVVAVDDRLTIVEE